MDRPGCLTRWYTWRVVAPRLLAASVIGWMLGVAMPSDVIGQHSRLPPLSPHITVPSRHGTSLLEASTEWQTEPLPRIPPVDAAESSRRRAEPPVESVAVVESIQPLRQVVIRITPGEGELPPDRATAVFASAGRTFHELGTSRATAEWLMQWEAPALSYRPLYFQEVNLERYGYRVPVFQPVVSAAHFFSRIPALPYLMVVEPPHQCRYALGYGRPGDCVPLYCYCPELRLDAAAVEAAVVAGAFIAFP